MEVSVKYLLPLLAVLNNKNYFCMVDYSYGNLYFITEPENEEIKSALEKEILRKVDIVAVKDIQEGIELSSSVSSILKDIENNEITKKYFEKIKEIEVNDEGEDDNGRD